MYSTAAPFRAGLPPLQPGTVGTTYSIRRRDEDDPILHAFMDAPEDDEPLTDADRAAVAEGKADAERGDVVGWEDYDPGRRARR